MATKANRNLSLNGATAGSAVSNKCRKKGWECSNPFPLTCINHGEDIAVRCGRWRTCAGCAQWKAWTIKQRFIAGIENVPPGKLADFITLTFPLDNAPDEDQAHRALRSLVGRLRYRGYLGAYGWVLQRQNNGTLHYHGIWHLPWFDDDLDEWRELIVKSGFGVQNKLVPARREHAGYCARYISKRLAHLAPLRRAFGFSRDFPRSDYEAQRALLAIGTPGEVSPEPDPAVVSELAQVCGVQHDHEDCVWVPSAELYG
jgi:hypothetical protein